VPNVLAGCGAQAIDFFQREGAEFAGRDIKGKRSVLHALDFFDVMPDFFEHAADLPIAAFDQCDLLPGFRGVFDHADFGWRSPYALAVIGCNGETAA